MRERHPAGTVLNARRKGAIEWQARISHDRGRLEVAGPVPPSATPTLIEPLTEHELLELLGESPDLEHAPETLPVSLPDLDGRRLHSRVTGRAALQRRLHALLIAVQRYGRARATSREDLDWCGRVIDGLTALLNPPDDDTGRGHHA